MASLYAIGVSGDPPDPTVEFGGLGSDQLSAGWLSGAVQPISLRGLAALLIPHLPRETVGWVGAAIIEACEEDKDGDPPHKAMAMLKLLTLNAKGLDSHVDEPIVSINPAASGREIERGLELLLPAWKAERSLPMRRDRSEKYTEYLQVWDLREGWVEGAYDRTREQTLREIAEQIHESISTVSNRYRSAFELIVGHEYSPELWFRIFGILKFSTLAQEGLARVSRRRPLRSRTRRETPEARLGGSSGDAPVEPVTTVPDASDHAGLPLLLSDIRRLIGRGWDDAEIAQELGLTEVAIPAIAALRTRQFEGL